MGEDVAAGCPGLSDKFDSERFSKVLEDEYITKESNRLEENCGLPQAVHCHDMLDDTRALYMWVVCMQSAWYHLLQSSHVTPLSFQVTTLIHT
jgi:hypothetical protein